MQKMLRFTTYTVNRYGRRHCLSVLQRRLNANTVTPLAAGYQPKAVEDGKWTREQEILSSRCKSKRKTFRMLLPPPNITGNLHLGHALMATVQDVICRNRRQLGYDVEWIPGTDHAGIATQVVVEKKLMSEKGISRQQLGRVAFLEEVWKWKEEKNSSIIEDLKKLGCSLNWNKEYFTMNKNQALAVNEAFIRLFEEGIIRRQKSLVNWSCALESAISDIEVQTVEVKGATEVAVPGYKSNVIFGRLFDIAYRIEGTDDEIVVSTTRPETMLGDVAVAVHPRDERYIKYRNMPEVKLLHPFRKDKIPLIFDMNVDPEFGTGAVKITPAHDKHDFEIASRHNLESINVFTSQGIICDNFEHFHGKQRFCARDEIIDGLEELKLLRLVRDHTMQLPYCSRSMDIIEYMERPQWFLHCQPLANAALSEVHSGRLQIIPPNFEVEWHRWLDDCKDWCISRQLWWGHQVPAYHATDKAGNSCWVAAIDEAEALKKASAKLNTKDLTMVRDEDVLDTWFSSSLLPFSVHNWPAEEYKQHYPLDLMNTGHDILFFWVARMVMLGLKLTGQAPFNKILLNGIVTDSHGRKMSKSLGNVITPQQVIQGATLQSLEEELKKSHKVGILKDEELNMSLYAQKKMYPKGIPECGTDALRFTLCSRNLSNHFVNFDVSECHTNKLFLNKIWQATRFTVSAAELFKIPLREIESLNNMELNKWDRWILGRLDSALTACAGSFESYNLHLATAALKNFFYYQLCDIYLETTKADIYASQRAGHIHVATLAVCLSWAIQAISPFTPFIAAELLAHLPKNPKLNLSKFSDPALDKEIQDIQELCQHVRQVKNRNRISRKHEPHVCLFAQNNEAIELLKSHLSQIKVLTQAHSVEVELLTDESKNSPKANFFSTSGPLCFFGITTNKLYAESAEQNELTKKTNEKKLKKLLTDLQRYRMRVENEAFQLMASKTIQKEFAEKIRALEAEIEDLKHCKL